MPRVKPTTCDVATTASWSSRYLPKLLGQPFETVGHKSLATASAVAGSGPARADQPRRTAADVDDPRARGDAGSRQKMGGEPAQDLVVALAVHGPVVTFVAVPGLCLRDHSAPVVRTIMMRTYREDVR